jgi:hypothetical protein
VGQKGKAMSANGTAYAAALTIRHLLRLLENKGLASSSEIRQLLDGVQGELREAGARGALSHDAWAEASQTIGIMSPPWSEPASIATEDLNASNDE